MQFKLYDLLVYAVDPYTKIDLIVEECNEVGEVVYASFYKGAFFEILNLVIDSHEGNDIVRSIAVRKNKLELIACKKYEEGA